jgi:hypothetical protein
MTVDMMIVGTVTVDLAVGVLALLRRRGAGPRALETLRLRP